MNPRALADELNQLLATETRSLFRHLAEAKPYLTRRTYQAWERIKGVSHASVEHAQRLTDLMARLDIPARPIGFPVGVADHHYTDLKTLLPLLIAEKRRQTANYERAIAACGNDSAAIAELESLLVDNQAQLATLEASRETAPAPRS